MPARLQQPYSPAGPSGALMACAGSVALEARDLDLHENVLRKRV